MACIARILGTVLCALAIAAAPVDPALAGSRGGVPPPDVQQVFDEVAIPYIHETAPGLGAPSVYEDVDGIENIAQLFVFTPAYLHGSSIGAVYEPTGEWIATITADFVAVGTVRVRTAGGVDPYVSEWDGDAEMAGKLANASGVDVIEDPVTGAFYAAFGGTIGPLNDAAVAQLPTPTTLPQFQQLMVARRESERETDASEPPSPGGILAISGVVLAIGAVVLLSARARARRSARG
jgi:hypothetical protein